MNNTTQTELCRLSKDELLKLSYDFIRFNINVTNKQIPSFLLKFWAMPNYAKDDEINDIASLIFSYILDLDFESNKQIEMRIVPETYRFSQLFHIFQVILTTTIYSRKYDLPIESFQIFRLDQYRIPELDGYEQLLKEYIRIIKPTELKKRAKESKKKYQLEISIVSKLSNIVFVEYFLNQLNSQYYLSYRLSQQMKLTIMAAVNHAILYIAKSEEEKPIHIGINKTLRGYNVTILCGERNESPIRHKFNPPKPPDNNDLKGYYLYTMKSLTDKVSFLDKGAEVTLVFFD